MSEANNNHHNYRTTDIGSFAQEPLAMPAKQNYKKSKNFDEL